MAKANKLLKKAGDWEKAASKLDEVATKLRSKAAEATQQAEAMNAKGKKGGGFGRVLFLLLVLGGAGFAATRLRGKSAS